MSTGDVGYFDEGGRLFVEGRDDEMIVSGGENVFPREVEDLIASRKEVSECAVIGVEDKEFGQRLKAFVVLNGGAKISEEEVKNFVKSNTARYKVPREVEFIKELPRNTTGKVLKRELVEQEASHNGASADAGKADGAEPDGTKKQPAKRTTARKAASSARSANASQPRAKAAAARRTRKKTPSA